MTAVERQPVRPPELDDIPGTTVFTLQRSHQGYRLNEFCMSLVDIGNRKRFQADERAYLDEWSLTDAAKRAVIERDYNALIEQGGNLFFLGKIFISDGLPIVVAISTMTGMPKEEYEAMMVAGGRSPDGWRSKRDGC